MTSAVTKGLPSRSPPIHEPNVRKGGTRNTWPGKAAARPRRSDSCTCGTASQSRGMIDRPRSTSSSTVGREPFKNSVSQRIASSLRSWLSCSARSRGRRSSRSRACRLCRMRRSLARIERRFASLGWAVNTSSIASRSSAACTSTAERPAAASSAMPAPSDSPRGCGDLSRSRSRSTRARCRSSAMFTRSKNADSARVTTRAWATSRDSIRAARARSASWPPARRSRASRRISATRADASAPANSTITESSLPSRRRTSRRRRSSLTTGCRSWKNRRGGCYPKTVRLATGHQPGWSRPR